MTEKASTLVKLSKKNIENILVAPKIIELSKNVKNN